MSARAAEGLTARPGAPASPPVLVVEDLSVSFATPDGVLKAVDGVSWEVRAGRTLGIVGESGSGKSVSVLALLGLLPRPPARIDSGRALFFGEDLLGLPERRLREIRGDRISMVFQDPMMALNPSMRIGWQVAEPMRVHRGLDRSKSWAEAVRLLERAGIPQASDRARDWPHEFSGGMRQRAMIAMALALEPDVIIADEPTTALDVTVQAQILELMGEIQERTSSALVLITHDLGVVADVADHVVVMYAGRVAERAPALELFADPRHPYTWGLMESVPRHDVRLGRRLAAIAGTPPSLLAVPSGCPFHPRCPLAQPICRCDVPALVAVGESEGEGGDREIHLAACHFAGDAGLRRRGHVARPEDGR